MKHLNCIIFLLALFATTSLTACDEDEEMLLSHMQPVPADYFTRCVDGKGWQYVESHEIKPNGEIEKRDYWAGGGGRTPGRLSFAGDSVTTYLSIGSYPISGYRTAPCTYDPVNNRVSSCGTELFRVASVSADELRLIKRQAVRADGTPVYVYTVYRAMSPAEFAAFRKKYRYNLDAINEQCPPLPEQTMITSADFERYAVGRGWRCAEAHRLEGAGRYAAADLCEGGSVQVAADYYISRDSIYSLTSAGEGETKGVMAVKYNYRANGFYVSTETGGSFRILSISDGEMKIVCGVQGADVRGGVGLYCVYRRMTDEELGSFGRDTAAVTPVMASR